MRFAADWQCVPVDGPTQTAKVTENRWGQRRALARVIRFLVAVAPTGAAIGTGLWFQRAYPPERLGMNRWVWLAMVLVMSIAVVGVVERSVRRLTPLVVLLKMSLIFPDQAPSRFKVAMRNGTTRSLQRRIDEIRRGGDAFDTETGYAERMMELVAALSHHDRLTRGHCERVRAYTDMVIGELGFTEDDANKLRWAALLHDVGKLMVPYEVLNKEGRPTEEEWEVLKSHTWEGQRLVKPLRPWLGTWALAVGAHHERWDGHGYPLGLKGEQIPLGGRIVAVTDAYDVMTSTRSYKKPLPAHVAREEIQACAGGQFDPDIVRAFLNIGLRKMRWSTGFFSWFSTLPAAQTPAAASAISAMSSSAGVVLTTGALVTGAAVMAPQLPVVGQYLRDGTVIEEVIDVDAFGDPAAPIDVAEGTPDGLAEVDGGGSEGLPDGGDVSPDALPTASETTQPPGPPRTQPVSAGRDFADTDDLTPITVDISANDIDPDDTLDPALTTLLLSDPGTWEVRGFEVTYTPRPGVAGRFGTGYQVCDRWDRCRQSTLTITVTLADRPPSAADDTVSTLENQPVTLNVLANDSDQEDTLSLDDVTVLPGGGGGSWSLDDAGIRFVPPVDGLGEFSTRYRVCDSGGQCDEATLTVRVVEVNNPPSVSPVDPIETAVGLAVDQRIVASDPEGATLTFAAGGLPAGLTLEADGRLHGVVAGGVEGTSPSAPVTVSDGQNDVVIFLTFDIADHAVGSLRGSLVLSEVLYAETGSDEFVELRNVGSEPIVLTGLRVADTIGGFDRESVTFTLPATDERGASSALAPGDIALVWLSQSAPLLPTPEPGTLEYVAGADRPVLDAGGDDIWVLDGSGALIDYAAWGLFADLSDAPPAPVLWDESSVAELGGAPAGTSISHAVAVQHQPQSGCWEQTGSGDAVTQGCAGAGATVDTDDVRTASTGRPNVL